MLIGFTGPMGSGKTTAANMMKAIAQRAGHWPEVLSFASPLKNAAMELFGFTEQQLYSLEGKEAVDHRWGISPREALQWLGTDVLRDRWPDFWVIIMRSRIQTERELGVKHIFIDDCRFSNEAELIRKMGGKVVHLDGRRVVSNHQGHKSEAGVAMYGIDTVIDNSLTLPRLKSQLDEVWHELADIEKKAVEADRHPVRSHCRDTW